LVVTDPSGAGALLGADFSPHAFLARSIIRKAATYG